MARRGAPDSEAPRVQLFSEAEMHDVIGSPETRAHWCDARARALVEAGNGIWAEQQALRERIVSMVQAGSKERLPELSPAMHIAAANLFHAAATYEIAGALHRIASRSSGGDLAAATKHAVGSLVRDGGVDVRLWTAPTIGAVAAHQSPESATTTVDDAGTSARTAPRKKRRP